MKNLAFISMHACPLARLGEKDSGGLNVYVLQTAKYLSNRGYNIDIFTRAHSPQDQHVINVSDTVRVIHIEAGSHESLKSELPSLVSDFQENLDLFKLEYNLNYELIHSHYWLSGQVGLSLSERWEIPHVTTFHTLALTKLQARIGEIEPAIRELTESKIARNVDAIIVSTSEEKHALTRLYNVHPDRIEVVTAGVDLERFHPIDKDLARKTIEISESNIILSVGRIDPLKGVDILIKAISMMDNTADTKVLIVGGEPESGNELSKLINLSNKLGLNDVLRFEGIVSQDMLPIYYSASDIFVMPSYYESFGLVALEAMACGVPVVASRVGGPRSLINQGGNGYLIPWVCPEPFSEKLEILLSNKILRENMANASISTARNLDWNNTVNKLSNIYCSLTPNNKLDAIGA